MKLRLQHAKYNASLKNLGYPLEIGFRCQVFIRTTAVADHCASIYIFLQLLPYFCVAGHLFCNLYVFFNIPLERTGSKIYIYTHSLKGAVV